MVTGLSINDTFFKKIIDSIYFLKEKSKNKDIFVMETWIENNTESKSMKTYTSVGGFFPHFYKNDNRTFPLNNISRCNVNRNEGYLNILSNGDLILCCVDWTRKTVFGNIKTQTLEQIWDSKIFNEIYSKSTFQMDSEKNFICRNCEFAY